jgi:SAM-dependent methyltransferase
MNNQNGWLLEWPEVFREVLEKIAEEMDLDEIHPIQDLSGASGAHTFSARAESARGRIPFFLLKLGTVDVLRKDQQGNVIAKWYFKNAHYQIHDTSTEGYVCSALTPAGGGAVITFESYYADHDADEVVKAIDEVFGNLLNYQNLNVKLSSGNVFNLYEFHNAEVMARELRRVGQSPPTLVGWWKRAQNSPDIHAKSATITAHGDLHGKNIMMHDDQPFLIDFGQTGDWHLMRDYAKLERTVRLFMYLDETSGYSNDEKNTKVLNEVIKNDGDLSAVPNEIKNPVEKAYKAVAEIRKHARELCQRAPDTKLDIEYPAALLAQFIFGAAIPALNKTRRKIASNITRGLRDSLEDTLGIKLLDEKDERLEQRKEVMWRFAYAFLRLDQLPSGGWARSLPEWMESIWEGDNGRINRHPDLYTEGGVDITCYAIFSYYRFMDKHARNRLSQLLEGNQVFKSALETLEKRTSLHFGELRVNYMRAADSNIRLRHTLMGCIAMIHRSKIRRYQNLPQLLPEVINYLVKYFPEWRRDKSHLFAMYVGCIKLAELLEEGAVKESLPHDSQDLLHDLRGVLENAFQDIEVEICKDTPYDAQPPLPNLNNGVDSFPYFKPYSNFWRMERSGLLMYLCYLFDDEGAEWNPDVSDRVKERCITGLVDVLEDIDFPCNPEEPEKSLIYYCRDLDPGKPRNRDWGLSAELTALLETPALYEPLLRRPEIDHLEERKKALNEALVHTFDEHHLPREFFRHTQSVAASQILNLVAPDRIGNDEISSLDKAIMDTLQAGVTEHAILNLIENHIITPELQRDCVDVNALKDFFVDGLRAGEFTPGENDAKRTQWQNLVNKAVEFTREEFYDGEGGIAYNNRYGDDAKGPLVHRLLGEDMIQIGTMERLKAIDVGCGPGQYARLLHDIGYDVELHDSSKQMLEIASKKLRHNHVPAPRDIYRLSSNYPEGEFDLVFACAMMVHVPIEAAAAVLQSFMHILKPGGLLFVNYKIRDHSLISQDGRYFQFYKDLNTPQNMLKTTGFEILETTIRSNDLNIHNDPRLIHWANFYCRKPVSTVP